MVKMTQMNISVHEGALVLADYRHECPGTQSVYVSVEVAVTA
jgi:hypothetical protein